ncbi:MAG: type 3 dihydrofolate reductase [Gammaproteobacteria bacterium]
MTISLIVAMSRNRVIGKGNALPWHLPADLKYFKRITLGKPIIMGRKTFESIGRPLPGRANIIITHERDYQATGCTVVHSIDDALTAAQGNEEIMVIGGAKLFEQILPRADRIYLTEIAEDFVGDVFFPALNQNDWRETQRTTHQPDDKNSYAYSFVVLDRSDNKYCDVTASL